MTSMDGRPTIRCFSGIPFDFENPEPKNIYFDDVAEGLAKCCRFACQCRGFYSVAEHSLLVEAILKFRGQPQFVRQLGLMHDAHEAYTGDMTSPLKKLCPDFKRIEEIARAAMLRRFRLPGPSDHLHLDVIKPADLAARAIEGRDLTDAGEREYGKVPEDLPASEFRAIGYDWRTARRMFVDKYLELFPRWRNTPQPVPRSIGEEHDGVDRDETEGIL